MKAIAIAGLLLLVCLAGCGAPTPPAPLQPSATLMLSSSPQPSATPTAPTFSPEPTLPATPSPAPTLEPVITAPAGHPQLFSQASYQVWELVTALAWNPSGSQLAVGAGDRVIGYAAPTETGLSELFRFEAGAWSTSLAFNPLSPEQLILTAKDGTLQIWNPAVPQRLASWSAHRKSANSLDFSPNGLVLASCGDDALVRLWDMAAWTPTPDSEPPAVEMIGGAYAVPAVRFSPDGQLVASIDVQAVRLRDTATQRLALTIRPEASIFAIAFRPAGQFLATAEMENRVRLWDVQTGAEVAAWQGMGAAGKRLPFIWSLAFSADGTWLAAGSSDGTLHVWNIAAGPQGLLTPTWEWKAHVRAISSLAFQPGSSETVLLASGGLDAAVHVWRIFP